MTLKETLDTVMDGNQAEVFVKRPKSNYIIRIDMYGSLTYVTGIGGRISKYSSVWDHEDFEFCNENGRLVKTINEEKHMKNDVNYIGGEYKLVDVIYVDNPRVVYTFKANLDLKLEKNDFAVVEASTGLGLVKVVETFENNISNADKAKAAKAWVVDKVDYSRQQSRKEATEKREYILQQLEEKKQQMEAVNMYEMLAKYDPEAAKLVEQLKEIGTK